jgi:ADP-ribosyl-[dinitrogen reductase] hydrolase
VPWEGKTPDEVHWEALEELPARGDWPRGSTSDDTDQMLLVAQYFVAQYFVETKGQVDEREFLTRLANALPRMRGVGPTTRAAVRRFVETGELRASEGSSIGAAMRALPFGWITPVAAVALRRELTVRLSRATHGAPAAIMSACLVAEMAAWAIEQHPIEAVVAAGLRETDRLTRHYALDSATMRLLPEAADGDWQSPKADMTIEAVATMAHILHVLREATGLASAMKQAVALGGDTDTAAAIVGGILGSQAEDVEGEIPWLSSIVPPEPAIVEATAAGLCGSGDHSIGSCSVISQAQVTLGPLQFSACAAFATRRSGIGTRDGGMALEDPKQGGPASSKENCRLETTDYRDPWWLRYRPELAKTVYIIKMKLLQAKLFPEMPECRKAHDMLKGILKAEPNWYKNLNAAHQVNHELNQLLPLIATDEYLCALLEYELKKKKEPEGGALITELFERTEIAQLLDRQRGARRWPHRRPGAAALLAVKPGRLALGRRRRGVRPRAGASGASWQRQDRRKAEQVLKRLYEARDEGWTYERAWEHQLRLRGLRAGGPPP